MSINRTLEKPFLTKFIGCTLLGRDRVLGNAGFDTEPNIRLFYDEIGIRTKYYSDQR
jgi:hypothetical protein